MAGIGPKAAGIVCALALPLGVPAAGAAATPKRADLKPGAVVASPASVAPGARLTVSYRARNAGNRTAPASRTTLLLSLDRKRNRGDVALGTKSLRRLRVRARRVAQSQVTVPSGTPNGAYFVLVCADGGKRVRERNERNNCAASARTISVLAPTQIIPPAPGPDPPPTPPDLTAPAAPTIEETSPSSPANDNSPEVLGSAEAGSTVRVYGGGDCTGTALATGSAAAFASPGLTATVDDDSTNSFRATATDAAGNTSACSAAVSYVEETSCPGAVDALLYEVNPNIASDRDMVELRVTSAGRLTGVTLEQSGAGTVVLATLPNVCVAAGDFVVIHLNPASAWPDETTTKTDCSVAECYASAWDLRGGTTGINFTDRVLTLRSAGGPILDAVAFANTGGPEVNGFPPAVQAIQAAGEWSPADCGGLPCTYTTTPTVEAISQDWNTAGTTQTGQSIQRIDSVDDNNESDWTVGAQSWGADTN